MSEQASHFKVGVFVIASAALLVTALSALGAGKLFVKTVALETVFEESTAGVDIGTPVKHRGVKVGTVRKIAFAGNEYPVPDGDPRLAGLVVVHLQLEEQLVPRHPGANGFDVERLVAAGLRARISTSGFVTPPFVELAFVDPAQAPPLRLPWTPRRGYVPSAPAPGSSVGESAEQLIRTVKATIASVSTDKIQGTLDDVAKASAELPGLLVDLRRLARRLDALVVAERASLDRAIGDLRDAASDARTFTDQAKRNPSWVLFGEPPPRVDPEARRKRR